MHRRNSFFAFFTLTLAGLFLSITGAIGWEPIKRDGLFFSGRWVDGPLWSQIGIGVACLIGAAIAFQYAAREARLRAAR